MCFARVNVNCELVCCFKDILLSVTVHHFLLARIASHLLVSLVQRRHDLRWSHCSG